MFEMFLLKKIFKKKKEEDKPKKKSLILGFLENPDDFVINIVTNEETISITITKKAE